MAARLHNAETSDMVAEGLRLCSPYQKLLYHHNECGAAILR